MKKIKPSEIKIEPLEPLHSVIVELPCKSGLASLLIERDKNGGRGFGAAPCLDSYINNPGHYVAHKLDLTKRIKVNKENYRRVLGYYDNYLELSQIYESRRHGHESSPYTEFWVHEFITPPTFLDTSKIKNRIYVVLKDKNYVKKECDRLKRLIKSDRRYIKELEKKSLGLDSKFKEIKKIDSEIAEDMAIRSLNLKEELKRIQDECSDQNKELAGYANGDYSKYLKREISSLTNFLNKEFE